MRHKHFTMLFPFAAALAFQLAVSGHATAADTSDQQMNAAQLFNYAESLDQAGQFANALTVYRALQKHPDPDLRREASFRLAMMLAHHQHKYGEAAMELRLILDEKPDAARVRLELARIEALDGQLSAATRDLRAAQASRLPRDVERMVRFYEQVLTAQRPFGGSIEVSLAPDSNVNRATSSGTLGTVLGDFALDERAKAHSGIGLGLRGQIYARQMINKGIFLVERTSASADIYRDTSYQDVVLAPALGPEIIKGKHRITLAAGPVWRWHGGQLYTNGAQANAAWSFPVAVRAQGRVELGLTTQANHFNPLENGRIWALSSGLDRAFTPSTGATLRLTANRVTAREHGYSTSSGNATASVWSDVGHTTLVASAGLGHLEADARFSLFPQRRIDTSASISLAASFRTLRWRGFVPLVRARYERNWSTVGLWDYSRFSGEVGVGSVL